MRSWCATLVTAALLSCSGGPAPSVEGARPAPGEGALSSAALRGDLEVVAALLERGEPVDQPGAESWTPLHRAAQAGQARAAALLLDAGADIEARARYDMRPLHWAALAGRLDVVQLLLARHAAVNATNLYDMTPLHLASSPETARALLEAGAQLEARDLRGMTPLHFARSHPLAKVLLDRGASVDTRDRRGLTPMDMTGVAQCTYAGLQVYPDHETARLPAETARLGLLIWNTTTRAMPQLELHAESPAADISVDLPRLPRFLPAQMTTLELRLQRRPDVAIGKHPLTLRFVTSDGEVARCALALDNRAGQTPEDRGMISVGSVKLREPPAWPQYLGFAAVPVIAVIVWLVGRRRETP